MRSEELTQAILSGERFAAEASKNLLNAKAAPTCWIAAVSAAKTSLSRTRTATKPKIFLGRGRSPQQKKEFYSPRTGLNRVVSHYQQRTPRSESIRGRFSAASRWFVRFAAFCSPFRRMRNSVRRWRTPLPPSIKRRQAVAHRGLTHPGSPMRGFGHDAHANFFVWVIDLAQRGTPRCRYDSAKCRRSGAPTGSAWRRGPSCHRG